MSNGIVIIGSGFAARQLVKNIRKQDATIPLTLIAADSMDEYNKPDLSHVISQGQRADDLTRQTAGEFAEQFNLHLFPQTWVTDIDAEARVVKSQNNQWQYDKLVLATGASAFVPPVPGRELMLTLNSQQEYRACETQLRDARRVLIVGGGLIGSELAMDFCRAGKAVTLIDNAASILGVINATGSKQPLAASVDGDGRSSVVEISVAGAGKNRFWHSGNAGPPAQYRSGCGNCRHRTAPGNRPGTTRRADD